jgi:PhzF family phenazine biosynthesis protein
MRTFPIVQVDAFTCRPFTGNPAAVCLLDDLPPEWWLLDVAREMNLARTAYLFPHEDGFDLRCFTPEKEVDVCGHTILACAHVVRENDLLPPDQPARFHTRIGDEILARYRDAWIEMEFPAQPVIAAELPCGLADALGVDVRWSGTNGADILIELADEKSVRTLCPDLAALARIPVRGVIVTSRAITTGVDFVSRYFTPRLGLPEDPATSSTHCSLAPFWAERLGSGRAGDGAKAAGNGPARGMEMGEASRSPVEMKTLIGYQVSSRGGTIRVRMDGDRVHLAGQAVTALRGTVSAG